MTDLDGTLSELARLRSGSEPIVTLYLDVRWKDEQQRQRVRLFVQERARRALGHYPRGAPGRDGLERTLARIEEYVSGLTGRAFEEDRAGLALFACESLGLWRPLLFARPFESELCTDAIPHLLQLARLRDDVGPALVIVPSQRGAEIYHVRLGELDVQAELRSFVPRRDVDEVNPGAAKPGRQLERAQRDDRHRQAFVQRNHRAAAAEATALLDRHRGSRLVLVGTSEVVAAFERELPERARSAIAGRVPRPRGWENGNAARRDRVKEIAEEVVREERRREPDRVDAVVGEALRGGLAVLGPGDVVLALDEGRVHELVIDEDFDRTGWRCVNCDALGENAESQEICPFCGGALNAVRDLGEALVARALAERGRVEVVAHSRKLHAYRGVAAFLRQTGPTGLRGESRPWPTAPGANR